MGSPLANRIIESPEPDISSFETFPCMSCWDQFPPAQLRYSHSEPWYNDMLCGFFYCAGCFDEEQEWLFCFFTFPEVA